MAATDAVGQDIEMGEFAAAYTAAFGRAPFPAEVERLRGDRVPVAMLAPLAFLIEHAVAHWGETDAVRARDYAEDLLLSVARHYAAEGNLTMPQMLGWLAVIAAAPDAEKAQDTAARLGGLKYGTALGHGWWLRYLELPDTVAPLVWAAGLTIDEAADGWAAGTLTEDRLRLLAGLRGWVSPPLP